MEIASTITLFATILAVGWYLSRRMDKTAAELRGEIRDVREKLVERMDKTAADLRGEIRDVRAELQKELRDTRAEIRGEVRDVGDKVERVEKQVNHY